MSTKVTFLEMRVDATRYMLAIPQLSIEAGQAINLDNYMQPISLYKKGWATCNQIRKFFQDITSSSLIIF